MNKPTFKMLKILICAIPIEDFRGQEASIEFLWQGKWYRIARSAFTDTGFVCTGGYDSEVWELICQVLSIWEKILLKK